MEPTHPTSIILPVYNQAGTAAAVFDVVRRYGANLPGCQFLFVDDGSTDGTGRLLQDLAQRAGSQNITVISYPRNTGKGFAVRTGVACCQGDVICFLDGDLAYSLDHVKVLSEALRSADVVIGSRHLNGGRQRNIYLRRRLLGWAFNRLARLVLGLPHRDTQAGAKGFRREVAHHLFGLQRIRGFAFDAELLFLARRHGYRIAEVPAKVSATHSYKVGKVRLLRDSLRMFREIVQIRCHCLRGAYDHMTPLPSAMAASDLPGGPCPPGQDGVFSRSGSLP